MAAEHTGRAASGAFHHVGLSCKDPVLIEQWYGKHFGFRRARVYAPGPGQVVMIRSGNVYLELFESKGESPAPPAEGAGPEFPGWRHIAFAVDDVDAKLREMGAEARITLGPIDFKDFLTGLKGCWISDPEGNIVELSEGFVDDPNPPPLAPTAHS